jgi:hypothetical protein
MPLRWLACSSEVRPYADGQSVHEAKLALNREGFQVIVRRQ